MKRILFIPIVLVAFVFISNAQLIKNDFMEGINIGEEIEKVSYDNKKSPIQMNLWHLAAYHDMWMVRVLLQWPL